MSSLRLGVYSITSEGTDAAVNERFPEVFSGIGNLADFQLKLHVNSDNSSVACIKITFWFERKVNKKVDELLEKD